MKDKVDMLVDGRESIYGSFEVQAKFAQGLKAKMREHPNYDDLPLVMQESLEMIMLKISRILNGDPCYPDHWDDIAGYTKLIQRWLDTPQPTAVHHSMVGRSEEMTEENQRPPTRAEREVLDLALKSSAGRVGINRLADIEEGVSYKKHFDSSELNKPQDETEEGTAY